MIPSEIERLLPKVQKPARCVNLVFAVIRDDINNSTNGITTIQRRCRTVQYFNSFHVCHVDAHQRIIANQFPSVH